MSAIVTDDRGEIADNVVITAPRMRWRSREALGALAAASFVAIVTIYRLGTLRHAQYPGHADPAFYYNVAQNIHAGRGAQVNFSWEYLSGQPSLPRYAFDYWLPLPSLLMSVALKVHDSFATALAVSVWMSVLLAVATYVLARCLTRSWWVPGVAAAIMSVQPLVSGYAVQSEAPLYFAAFATLALAAAIGARSHAWLWPVAGALSALANLARSEGLLLIIALIITALACSAGRRRLVFAGALVGGYVLTMSPLYVVNYRNMGSLMPPSSAKLPFVRTVDDTFSLHVTQAPSAFFGHSVNDFVMLRLTTLVGEMTGLLTSMYSVDVVLVVILLGVGLSGFDRRWWHRSIASPWFAPAAFAIVVLLFYALIVPALTYAMLKWMIAFTPALVVGALMKLDAIALRPAGVMGVVVALVATPLLTVATVTRQTIDHNNSRGAVANALGPVLAAEQACLGKPVVLMTRIPWEITQTTGIRTVMIPNGALPDILEVAHRYGATDIRVDVDYPALSLATMGAPGGPFGRSVARSTFQIYRIKANVAGARC